MSAVSDSLRSGVGARWWEFAIWLLLLVLPLLLPKHSLLISEITTIAMFAMSLDLVLGYSGIVSLGHAAFFGAGAYTAALFQGRKIINQDSHSYNTLNQLNYTAFYLG